MDVIIPEEILLVTKMSPQEVKQELAITLFEKKKLTLKQAADLAEPNRIQFQHLLASHSIPVRYDVDDFEEDRKTLEELGVL